MKSLDKYKDKWNRENEFDGFTFLFEFIFYLLNLYIIIKIVDRNKDTLVYSLLTLHSIALLFNLLFLMFSRFVVVEERSLFDYTFYTINYFLFSASIILNNMLIFKDSDKFFDYSCIALVLYMICDYVNYIVYQKYESKTFVFLILIILFISISINDNTYNVVLAFLIYILGFSDADTYLKFFKIKNARIKKDVISRDKFIVILVLLDIFISMSFSKLLIRVYLYFKRLSIENMILEDYFNYGLFRFLIFSVLYLFTLDNANKIKEKINKFFNNRYVRSTKPKRNNR